MRFSLVRTLETDTIQAKTVNSKTRVPQSYYLQKSVTGLNNSNNIWSSKDCSGYKFSLFSGMTLAGSRSVVSKAHIQALIFFTGAYSQDHGRLPDKHVSKHSHKNLHTCWTPWSAPQKNGELCARPPVLKPLPSQANHSSPPIAVGPGRVTLARNLHTCFDSLVRVSSHSRETCSHVGLGPCFATATLKKIFQKENFFFCLSLSGSLGLVVRTWKHGCGPGHTRQPARETTERDAEM